MKFKIGNDLLFSISIFLIYISNTKILISLHLNSIIGYLGYFIILFCIYTKTDLKKSTRVIYVLVIFLLFSIGLVLQDLRILRKISLLLSMFILCSIATIPCDSLSRINDLQKIRRPILIGIILSSILSLASGVGVFTIAVEGAWNVGFDAGLEHKNYFAYLCISLFLIERILLTQSHTLNGYYWMALWSILIVFSNSRSALIVWLVIVCALLITRVREIKHYRTFFALCVWILVFILICLGYSTMAKYSASFSYRFRGIGNYLRYYGKSGFAMLFGTAGDAFRDSGLEYVDNVRSIIGWDGTLEVSYLNILIKNGMIGLCGYFVVFYMDYKSIRRIKDITLKTIMLAFLFSFMLSGTFESFVGNIKLQYSVICYLILCNSHRLEKGD